MTARVFLPPSLQADIENHARASNPNECCGILIGLKDANSEFKVTRILPSNNVTQDNPQRSFEIDPTLLIRTQRELRDMQEDLIGYYHSHPNGPAEPSDTDRVSALEAGKIWLIVGTPSEPNHIETKGFVTIGAASPLGFRPVELMSGAHLNER